MYQEMCITELKLTVGNSSFLFKRFTIHRCHTLGCRQGKMVYFLFMTFLYVIVETKAWYSPEKSSTKLFNENVSTSPKTDPELVGNQGKDDK